jgi:hypothetical protein
MHHQHHHQINLEEYSKRKKKRKCIGFRPKRETERAQVHHHQIGVMTTDRWKKIQKDPKTKILDLWL